MLNRQNLKWQSSTHSGEADESHAWNKVLVTRVLPQALTHMIVAATSLSISHKHILLLFPERPSGEWLAMTTPFYEQIVAHNILYSEEGGGRWLSPNSACVIDAECPDSNNAAVVIKTVLLSSSAQSNLVEIPSCLQTQLNDAMPEGKIRTVCPLLNSVTGIK